MCSTSQVLKSVPKLWGSNKIATLCIIHQPAEAGPRRVLLGFKKRGFGQGKWNGFGGKVEKGESIEQAAMREVKEEAGLELQSIRQCGLILFEFEKDAKFPFFEVHIFESSSFLGAPRESEEMRPQWFSLDRIPYQSMWKDDKVWLPLLLQGQAFRSYCLFRGHNVVLRQELEQLPPQAFRTQPRAHLQAIFAMRSQKANKPTEPVAPPLAAKA